jgi:hypothetical protein
MDGSTNKAGVGLPGGSVRPWFLLFLKESKLARYSLGRGTLVGKVFLLFASPVRSFFSEVVRFFLTESRTLRSEITDDSSSLRSNQSGASTFRSTSNVLGWDLDSKLLGET